MSWTKCFDTCEQIYRQHCKLKLFWCLLSRTRNVCPRENRDQGIEALYGEYLARIIIASVRSKGHRWSLFSLGILITKIHLIVQSIVLERSQLAKTRVSCNDEALVLIDNADSFICRNCSFIAPTKHVVSQNRKKTLPRLD